MSKVLSYRDALHRSMQDIMAEQSNSIVIGQGVNDPTRIFGTTAGLLEKHGPNRIFESPIAEEGMTGVALGAGLNGLFPIMTHIRVDFLLLAMNQLVNMGAKYKYMYDGEFEMPLLVRTVVGRSWGQGPQHSQSLQALFAHIPGLTVLMPANANSAYNAYRYVAKNVRTPVLSIEHRLLYDFTFHWDPETDAKEHHPLGARIVEKGKDITIVATSYMVQEAQRAAAWAKEKKGIECEIIDLHNVTDFDHELVHASLKKTGKLIVADTSWSPYGVAAEAARGIMERNPSLLKAPMKSFGMAPCPTPTSHALEALFYPDWGALAGGIFELVLEKKDHKQELPTAQFIKDQRAKFRGPF